MKVVYSSANLVSYPQLKYLLAVHFFMAVAFGSDELQLSSRAEDRYNKQEEDIIMLKRKVDALETAARATVTPNGQDIIMLKREVDALRIAARATVTPNGGAVYTRWGRNVCPSGTQVVYNGVAGGSHYSHSGGGSNYLCLPLHPAWGAYNTGVEKPSKLYGSEYQGPTGFRLHNNHYLPLHDNNVPCVVCRSQTKTSVVMIPARNLCYNGWNTEYTGFLMSEYIWHKGRTEFVCMDGEPESVPYGSHNEDGALFHNVEGVCGSLPCPPYVARREVTCAVCTQ